MDEDIGKAYVTQCGHCGNVTPQKVMAVQDYDEVEGDGDESFVIGHGKYYMTVCATCREVSLFLSMEYGDPRKKPFLYESTLKYPATKQLPEGVVPNDIIRTYSEAVKIKKISPPLFVVQIGKALEFLCKDQKAKGKTLDKQIQYLSLKGVVPPTFSKMTNILRTFRNYGAHASDIDIGAWDANIIDDFFNALVEYVYIAPHKVSLLLKKIKNKGKDEPITIDLTDVKDNASKEG